MGTEQNLEKVVKLLPYIECVVQYYLIFSVSYILLEHGTNIAK